LDIGFLVSFAWRIRGADYTRACEVTSCKGDVDIRAASAKSIGK
jgi:hypothetical protein